MQIDQKTDAANSTQQTNPAGSLKITEKYYWGCGDSIAPGQPVTSTNNPNATNGDTKPLATASAVPNASYAYWPTEKTKPLTDDVKAEGSYALTTNYAGSATVTLDSEQNNLAPLDISELTRNYDLANPIKLKWNKIPYAKAYYVSAYGGNDNEIINWNSSTKANTNIDFTTTALTAEQLKKYLEDGVLMSADTTSCTIPARIFKDSLGTMVTVVAIGKDTIQTKDDVETRLLVRSTADISFIRME